MIFLLGGLKLIYLKYMARCEIILFILTLKLQDYDTVHAQ
jgi:hypothetical protein